MEEQPPTLPSLSSFTCDCTYDVFLSFRGDDTRRTILSHLYSHLQERGIQTFFDEKEIRKGEQITPTLLQAIKESRIFIAIFSPNYASSTFCLTELVNILECSKLQGRLFLPVFYGVDPSHVRNITGTFAEAFLKHEVRFRDEKEKVQKWRDALRQAADISGWHLEHFIHFTPAGSETEKEFIEKIFKQVSIMINRAPLEVAKNPVGLESRMLEVTSRLGLESDESDKMVGIFGIGGIGKTTTARAVHNLIAHQFGGVCFLHNIREMATTDHKLAKLQEQLLSEILWEKDIKVGDIHRGKTIIKRRLKKKKVLLILDNVDKKQQLEALAGGRDWFGIGSKIIVTTRDKHLLDTHGIVKQYEVKQLKNEKALELFSWHAFHNEKIDPGYVDIAKRAVSYCNGLPLALELIGSRLFGKPLAVWKSFLDKCAGVLFKGVHEILKVSYGDLEEDVKGIFLDIACFFNSYEISYVKEILYLHGFHAEDGIRELIDKCLMKIDTNGCLRMHDLIQDMGRTIVREESESEPGKRSRLWFSDDIVHVLEENKGTDTIEVIILDLHKDRKLDWCGDAFGKMTNLRILIIRNGRFSRGPLILPNSLRVLDWNGYESSSLPSGFIAKKLAILNLPESPFECFESLKVFEMLSFLSFEGCKLLTKLPSLSSVPNLGSLCLDNCTDLIEIHDSIGFLAKLVSLTAQGCTKLERLVRSINLPSLETLDLRDCSHLARFPEVEGVMESIKDVYLDHTALEQLPLTIGNLVGLQRLFLRGCQRMIQLPSYILPKVEILTTYGCRGFRSSENEEKVSPKVFPKAMRVNNAYGDSFLDVYARNISSNDVIEVCSPLYVPESELIRVSHSPGSVNVDKLRRNESSVVFRFRNKFPRITLSCKLEPEKHFDYMVLDFKLNVLINGTEQLTSSCKYIFYSKGKMDQLFQCDLRCKVEGIFSENEWNHVEILCKIEHLLPCGSKMAMAYQHSTTESIVKLLDIKAYREESNIEDIDLIQERQFSAQETRKNLISSRKDSSFSYSDSSMDRPGLSAADISDSIMLLEHHLNRLRHHA